VYYRANNSRMVNGTAADTFCLNKVTLVFQADRNTEILQVLYKEGSIVGGIFVPLCRHNRELVGVELTRPKRESKENAPRDANKESSLFDQSLGSSAREVNHRLVWTALKEAGFLPEGEIMT